MKALASGFTVSAIIGRLSPLPFSLLTRREGIGFVEGLDFSLELAVDFLVTLRTALALI